MVQRSVHQIVRTIEGVIELCLGKAGCVVWVDQADAAAFADGEKVYLPMPDGQHPQEYELLLSLGLREVAKLEHSVAADFAVAADDVKPYASTFEDVRVKRLLSRTYRGAPQIFAKAFELATDIFMKKAEGEDLDRGDATRLAIWGQANDALIQSESSRLLADALAGLAASEADPSAMRQALQLAANGPVTLSTAEAVQLGDSVYGVLSRRDLPLPSGEAEQSPAGADHQPGEGDAIEQGHDGGDAQTDGSGDQRDSDQANQCGDAAEHANDERTGAEQAVGQSLDEDGGEASRSGGTGDDQREAGSADRQAGAQGQPEGGANNGQPPGPEAQTVDPEAGGHASAEQGAHDDGGQTAPLGGMGEQDHDAAAGAAHAGGRGQDLDEREAGQADGTGDQPGGACSGEQPAGGQGQRDDAPDARREEAGQGVQSHDEGDDGQQATGRGEPNSAADGGELGGAGDQARNPGGAERLNGGPETQASADGRDFLSDALAMLRGFSRARDCAAEVLAAAGGLTGSTGAPAGAELRQAVAVALDNAESPLEALDAAVGSVTPEAESAADAGAAAEMLPVALGAGDGLADQYCEATNSLLPRVAGRLVSVLLRELQDRRRRPSRVGSSGPRVDVAGIWKLQRLGDPSVFRTKTRVPGVSAAIQILLDRSGSMELILEAAADVTYALALAHHRIAGAQVAIDMFPGVEGCVEPVLAFGQHPMLAKKKLRGVGASGGTPTGEALQSVLPRLQSRRVEKRILYVLTDGQPNREQRDLTRQLLAQAAAQGIEPIGIGIGVDVGHLFPLSITVGSVDDLPRALEALFKSEVAKRLAA